MKIKLIIEYDGTNYSGWQRQNNAVSIQSTIEEAIEKATGQKVVIHGAGRTDAGVHAVGQCAHFEIDSKIPAEKFSYVLNLVLPADIRIKNSIKVLDSFHARYDAVGKHYRYVIYQGEHDTALYRNIMAHVRGPLCIEDMKAAAKYLEGTHDFAAFHASGTNVQNTVRTISKLSVEKYENDILIDVMGTGFLYNMVRIIAGTLIEIGRGRRDIESVRDALQSGDRRKAGVTAPAKGLTLMSVFYDKLGQR